MSTKTLLTAVVAVALVAPLAGQKVKVPKPPPPPAYATVTVAGDVNSGTSAVEVGRDVATYGPTNQELYIHKSLLPDTNPDGVPGDPAGLLKAASLSGEFYGPYYGQTRVLDDRIDYFFDTGTDCVADNVPANRCPFRLVVADGKTVCVKVGKTRVLDRIEFLEGRYLLDYRPCDPALDPDNCYFKLLGCYDDRDCPGVIPGDPAYYIYATLRVLFQEP